AGAVMDSELIATSAGAGDAGKPIKLDAAGHVDASMINDGDIDHTAIANIGTNSHAAIDSHIASAAAHGATGEVVGTTNTQTLSNKTLTSAVISTIFRLSGVTATIASGAFTFTGTNTVLDTE